MKQWTVQPWGGGCSSALWPLSGEPRRALSAEAKAKGSEGEGWRGQSRLPEGGTATQARGWRCQTKPPLLIDQPAQKPA